MEMRHERPRRRHEVDKVVGEQVRLYGADTVADNALHLVKFAAKVEQAVVTPGPEIADVHPGDYNLFSSGFGCRLGLGHDVGDCSRT